jgi:hypothetical protein
MARICIVPANDTDDPTATTTAAILSLPHPRATTPTRYLVHPTKGLHELTSIPSTSSQPRSWLLTNTDAVPSPPDDDKSAKWIGNGQILEDGTLYIATPIDPLFLLLPHLLPASAPKKKDHFLPTDDILESLMQACKVPDKLPVHWGPVMRAGTITRRQFEARIRAVSETVDAGDDKAYRVSQEKVMAVLARKCGDMAMGGLPKSLEDEFVAKPLVRPVTGVVSNPELMELTERGKETSELKIRDTSTKASADAPRGSESPPEIVHLLRLKVAARFLAAAYLPSHIAVLLTAHLDSTHDFASLDVYLQKLKKLRAEAAAVRSNDFSLKRSMNDDEAADLRAEKKRKEEEEDKKKKKSISRGIRELSKVNTRGMTKLTSFFKKKE